KIVIAEDLFEFALARSCDEHLPVVVTDLVAEMTAQRAVRLVVVDTQLLTLDVVGLANVDRDLPVPMTGINPFARQRAPDACDRNGVGLEIERKRRRHAVLPAAVRKMEKIEQVQQAAFG